MTDISKMAKTCAINFLTLVSYSTSIVIGGLQRLLLPVLMWAGVDLEYFAQNRQSAIFCIFSLFLITHNRKMRKRRETIIGSLVECWVLYWYSLKHLLCSIYFADTCQRNIWSKLHIWRCKCAIRTLPRKHVRVRNFVHSSLPRRTSLHCYN